MGVQFTAKGYRDYLVGTKTVEEIMGTSTLQWFIITAILRQILDLFRPDDYLVGTNKPGIHVERGTNLANDIAIYRKGQLKIALDNIHYANVPPQVVIEVDVRADCSDLFSNEFEYVETKSQRLLDFWRSESNLDQLPHKENLHLLIRPPMDNNGLGHALRSSRRETHQCMGGDAAEWTGSLKLGIILHKKPHFKEIATV
ncbi:hypothetical protein [Dyadobacter sp. 676]|uniref:Uncharacterized protein n=1 Tax=Dyadobacter sp. 676 TaxID=3088362 RepID=A0AAU8FFC1_9BACT